MSKTEKAEDKKVKSDAPMEELEIGNAIYKTHLTKKFKERENWKRPDESRIFAVIPGNIQRVMVKEGQEVEAGTPLLILEAMKMRNQVKAAIPGTILKIYVKEGEMVPKNHLLVEFK